MKHYRITNSFRFTVFCLIVFLLFSFIVLSIVNVSGAKEMLPEDEGSSYIEVYVEEGDTLWEIAKEYGNNEKDVREIIYEICKLNGIKASQLLSGSTILVPVE